MQAYEVRGKGLDCIQLIERKKPELKPNEILVKVKAVSLNYRDYMIATGTYRANLNYPMIPLSDGAGEVVETGHAVKAFCVKDRVAGTFFPYWDAGSVSPERNMKALGGDLDGMLAEYVALPETGAVSLPDSLSYEEAATLPCAGLTAWNALFCKGNIKPGQTVLVLGTGGVSIFALQFAKAAGAHVIVTSSSDEKLKKVKTWSADETINYKKTPNWDEEVYKLTHKRGVDQVIEVGGAGTFSKSLRAVRIGGTVSMIGVLAGISASVDTVLILGKSIDVHGIYVGNRSQFIDMIRGIKENRIRPVIDQVFDFSETGKAYKALQAAGHVGKIVIKI
ncbi:MAG TPA: NAD(P)-dependent alcohol dehydrogenase [Gammaproteobacteria bacterium]|nr:NAD(P)-dependent alcohol dehydrogenase [Gammaproteobacteria bacterium]